MFYILAVITLLVITSAVYFFKLFTARQRDHEALRNELEAAIVDRDAAEAQLKDIAGSQLEEQKREVERLQRKIENMKDVLAYKNDYIEDLKNEIESKRKTLFLKKQDYYRLFLSERHLFPRPAAGLAFSQEAVYPTYTRLQEQLVDVKEQHEKSQQDAFEAQAELVRVLEQVKEWRRHAAEAQVKAEETSEQCTKWRKCAEDAQAEREAVSQQCAKWLNDATQAQFNSDQLVETCTKLKSELHAVREQLHTIQVEQDSQAQTLQLTVDELEMESARANGLSAEMDRSKQAMGDVNHQFMLLEKSGIHNFRGLGNSLQGLHRLAEELMDLLMERHNQCVTLQTQVAHSSRALDHMADESSRHQKHAEELAAQCNALSTTVNKGIIMQQELEVRLAARSADMEAIRLECINLAQELGAAVSCCVNQANELQQLQQAPDVVTSVIEDLVERVIHDEANRAITQTVVLVPAEVASEAAKGTLQTLPAEESSRGRLLSSSEEILSDVRNHFSGFLCQVRLLVSHCNELSGQVRQAEATVDSMQNANHLLALELEDTRCRLDVVTTAADKAIRAAIASAAAGKPGMLLRHVGATKHNRGECKPVLAGTTTTGGGSSGGSSVECTPQRDQDSGRPLRSALSTAMDIAGGTANQLSSADVSGASAMVEPVACVPEVVQIALNAPASRHMPLADIDAQVTGLVSLAAQLEVMQRRNEETETELEELRAENECCQQKLDEFSREVNSLVAAASRHVSTSASRRASCSLQHSRRTTQYHHLSSIMAVDSEMQQVDGLDLHAAMAALIDSPPGTAETDCATLPEARCMDPAEEIVTPRSESVLDTDRQGALGKLWYHLEALAAMDAAAAGQAEQAEEMQRSLNAELAAKQAELDEAAGELVIMAAASEALVAQNEALVDENSQMLANYEVLAAEYEVVRAQLADIEAQRSLPIQLDIIEDLSGPKADAHTTNQMLNDTCRERDLFREESGQLAETREGACRQVAQLEIEMAQLREALNHGTRERDALKSEAAQLQASMHNLCVQKSAVEAELTQLRASLQLAFVQGAGFAAQETQLKPKRMHSKMEDCCDLHKQLEECTQKLATAEDSISKLREVNTMLVKTIAASKKGHEALSEQLPGVTTSRPLNSDGGGGGGGAAGAAIASVGPRGLSTQSSTHSDGGVALIRTEEGLNQVAVPMEPSVGRTAGAVMASSAAEHGLASVTKQLPCLHQLPENVQPRLEAELLRYPSPMGTPQVSSSGDNHLLPLPPPEPSVNASNSSECEGPMEAVSTPVSVTGLNPSGGTRGSCGDNYRRDARASWSPATSFSGTAVHPVMSPLSNFGSVRLGSPVISGGTEALRDRQVFAAQSAGPLLVAEAESKDVAGTASLDYSPVLPLVLPPVPSRVSLERCGRGAQGGFVNPTFDLSSSPYAVPPQAGDGDSFGWLPRQDESTLP